MFCLDFAATFSRFVFLGGTRKSFYGNLQNEGEGVSIQLYNDRIRLEMQQNG